MSTQNPAVVLDALDDDDNATLGRLQKQLTEHQRRNEMLDAYYEAERNLRRWHGGVVPAQYYRLGLVLGWSAKAVDALQRRCNLEGLVWPGGNIDDTGYREVWDGNRLGAEVDQGITSALIHGLAFVVASRGDVGEPDGLVHFYSANDATGTRNPRTRQLEDLLVVNSRDKDGRVTGLTLYLDGRTVTAENRDGWDVEVSEHPFGVPAAPLVYRPRLGKTFGRSRLTRPVRGIQDAAARALVRLEGHMDVYAYPEFWLLGADLSIFRDEDGNPIPEWQRRLGRIKGIPDDENASSDALARADVKKFDAASPEPHLAALNAYAKLFAREASLPDSAVAITDLSNPTSEGSYDASQYELIAEAEGAQAEFGPALRHVVPLAMAMASGLTEVPQAWSSMDCDWRNARFVSRAAQADAGAKQIAAAPWLAETRVGLKMLGLSDQEIDLALNERQRAAANGRLDALIAAGQAPGAVES